MSKFNEKFAGVFGSGKKSPQNEQKNGTPDKQNPSKIAPIQFFYEGANFDLFLANILN